MSRPTLSPGLLSRLIPAVQRDEIVGNLVEEAGRRLDGGGSRVAATLWLWFQITSVAAHLRVSALLRSRGFGVDARIAIRQLGRDPPFTLSVVLAVAVGIGLNAVILGSAGSVLFDPLPYPAANRIGVLTNDHTGSSTGGFGVSWLNASDAFDRVPGVEDRTLFLDWQDVHYTGPERAHRIPASFVDDRYFELLGLRAGLGRLITPGENGRNPASVAVLTQGTWRRVFGADASVVGRTVRLGGRPYQIVGVLDDDRADLRYRWGEDPVGVLLPLFAAESLTAFRLDAARDVRVLNALVRIAEGTTMSAVGERFRHVSRELAEAHPEANRSWSYDLQPLHEAFFETTRPAALALVLGSALVLLLVAVNVLGLVLVRSVGRTREMAVRRAMGAGRGRLFRQTLTEGALLAALGGGSGLLLASWLGGSVTALPGVRLPSFANVGLDARSVAASLVATVAIGLALGVLPTAARDAGLDALKGGARAGARPGRRRLVIVAQVALAFTLLVGAGLMLESFRTLRGTGYGFDTERLLTARIDLRGERYEGGSDVLTEVARRLREEGQAIPGVESAFIWGPNRLGHGNQVAILAREDRYVAYPEERLEASRHSPHPGTLGALGIPLVAGRDFAPADDADAPPVAIVSESLAADLWPAGDAVGGRLETFVRDELQQIEVVGVAADARHRTRLIEPFGPQRDVYFPFAQRPARFMSLALRLQEGAQQGPTVAAVRDLVRSLDPDLPAYDIRTMADRMRDEEAEARLAAQLVSLYGMLALGLAIVGVYGMLAHSVQRRRREIGVRMALGADTGRVAAEVVGRGLRTALLGSLIGAAAALLGARVISSALYGVSAWNPWVFVGVALTLLAATAVGCLLPATRAARVDPATSLKVE